MHVRDEPSTTVILSAYAVFPMMPRVGRGETGAHLAGHDTCRPVLGEQQGDESAASADLDDCATDEIERRDRAFDRLVAGRVVDHGEVPGREGATGYGPHLDRRLGQPPR